MIKQAVRNLITTFRHHRTTLLLFGWMSICPLLSSSIISYKVVQYEQALSVLSGEIWLLIGVISCLAMGIALIPASLVALVAGYFLGFSTLPGVVILYTLASLIGFQLTRWIDQGVFIGVLKQLPPKQAKVAHQIERGIVHNQLGLTTLARMSPIMPFTVMNMVLPLAGVSLRNYLLGGFIGMLPRTFFLIWLGNQAQEIRFLIEHNGDITTQLLSASIVVLTLIGTGYYAKRIFQQQLPQTPFKNKERQ